MNILNTWKKQTNKHLGEITSLEDWDGEEGLTFKRILTQPVNGIHLNFLLTFIYAFWFQKN
jgi:hypothetical protein